MTTQAQWRPWIVLVGGFLGAGKTSLILAAARILKRKGVLCAVVLNDQGDDLVDTNVASRHGLITDAVMGGCFCCHFTDFLSAIERLRPSAPEVIFAEPVGSCTDLAATVLRPLLEDFKLCRVAPLTVLVDPSRATALERPNADPHLQFLLRKQLEEADLVYITKADLYPGIRGLQAPSLSAKTGEGIEGWLDVVLAGNHQTGGKDIEVDYEEYARAEGALAWLNLSLRLHLNASKTPAHVVGALLEDLDHALSAAGIQVVHLKLMDRSPTGWIKAAICANGEVPKVEGCFDASATNCHELLLNLRALGRPQQVRSIAEAQIGKLDGNVLGLWVHCFSPPPPKPERRIFLQEDAF